MGKLKKLLFIPYIIPKKTLSLDFTFLKLLANNLFALCTKSNDELDLNYHMPLYLEKGSSSYNSLKKSTTPIEEQFNTSIPLIVFVEKEVEARVISIFRNSLNRISYSSQIYALGKYSDQFLSVMNNDSNTFSVEKINDLNDVKIKLSNFNSNGAIVFFEPCWFQPDLILRFLQVSKEKKSCLISSDHTFYNLKKNLVSKIKMFKPSKYLPKNYDFDSIGLSLFLPKDKYSLLAGISSLELYSSVSEEAITNIPLPLTARIIEDLRDNLPLKVYPVFNNNPKITYPTPKVIAVVPFKDEKELTQQALESLKRQENIELVIALVNNNSSDKEFIKELESDSKVRLIHFPHTYNFSAINNYAIEQLNKEGVDHDYIFFMNNDVELINSDTISKMIAHHLRDPKIGIVGVKLLYPSGLIQHGGIDHRKNSNDEFYTWTHTDILSPPHKNKLSNFNRVVDAVTAACCIVPSHVFKATQGFDQINYPIAYSDTNLCEKIQSLHLKVFYTSDSEAIHYEGASRGKDAIEDFEKNKISQ